MGSGHRHLEEGSGPSWRELHALGFGSPQHHAGPESHQQALLGAGGGDTTGDITTPDRQVWAQPRGITQLPLLLKRMGTSSWTPLFYYNLKCCYKITLNVQLSLQHVKGNSKFKRPQISRLNALPAT